MWDDAIKVTSMPSGSETPLVEHKLHVHDKGSSGSSYGTIDLWLLCFNHRHRNLG